MTVHRGGHDGPDYRLPAIRTRPMLPESDTSMPSKINPRTTNLLQLKYLTMKIKTCLLLSAWCCTTVMAQENYRPKLDFEIRQDYKRTYVDGETRKEDCGFKGNVMNVILKGKMTPELSYGYRQRLSGINKDRSFFDATDWVYLDYQATPHWSLMAGKQIVYVGGWDLEPAPIDVYHLSEFTYNFPCYEWGGIVSYNTLSGSDKVSFQLCESPFRKSYMQQNNKGADMYAYNLVWFGRHGFFEPIWSVNLMEYAPGKFINYIALGSKFHLNNRLQLDVDVINRAAEGQAFFFRDCSFMCKLAYQPSPRVNVFAKMTYDVNKSGTDADMAVLDGTEMTAVGGGVEYFPLKKKNVRLHSSFNYSFGTNTNPNGVLVDKRTAVDVGVTWRVNIL